MRWWNMAEPFPLLLLHAGVIWGRWGLVWMGGDDSLNVGNFAWSDGTPLPINDPMWDAGEPNRLDNSEHCLSLFANRYTMNDDLCSKTRSYICQIDM